MFTAIQETNLLAKIKKKDLNAILDWFESRKSKYYRIGWAYLKNHHDIEDVFHNTIIKVYEKIDQLREERYFESWVTSIFLNECKAVCRKNKPRRVEDVSTTEGGSEYEAKLEVYDILTQMDEKYKEVIILKYLEGFSQDEISRLLEIPIGTVKSRLYRGLLLLRKALEGGERL